MSVRDPKLTPQQKLQIHVREIIQRGVHYFWKVDELELELEASELSTIRAWRTL